MTAAKIAAYAHRAMDAGRKSNNVSISVYNLGLSRLRPEVLAALRDNPRYGFKVVREEGVLGYVYFERA